MNLQLPPRNILNDAELPPLPSKVDALPDIPTERLRTRGCEAWESTCRLIAATDLILEYNAELWRVFGNDLGEHWRASCGNDIDQRGPHPGILMRAFEHADICIQLLASMKVSAEPWNQMTVEAIRLLLPHPHAAIPQQVATQPTAEYVRIAAERSFRLWLTERDDRCLTLRGHAVNLRNLLKEGPITVLKSDVGMVKTKPHSDKQRAILDALSGRALIGKELLAEVTTALGHTIKPNLRSFLRRQLKPLMDAGLVSSCYNLGYYRPDAPPL